MLRWMIASALCVVFLTACLISSTGAQADQDTCPLGSEFTLVKNRDNQDWGSTTSWQILFRGRLVYNINRAELGDIYGGYPAHGGNPPAGCGGIAIGSNFFGLVMGHQTDLLMLFGIEHGPTGLRGVKVLRYYSHDGGMRVSATNNELHATYGRLGDLNARFCWNPNGDFMWWHNHYHREGLGPCVENTWPWQYPTTNVTE